AGVVERVASPNALAGGRVEAIQDSGRSLRENFGVIDSRRRTRADATLRAAEASGVGVVPQLAAGLDVVADAQLVVAALLQRPSATTNHGERAPTRTDRMLPELLRRSHVPVGSQRFADDHVVSIRS